MQLGLNYDAAGNAAACALGGYDANGDVVLCYTSAGAVCDSSTPLVDKCPRLRWHR